MNIKFSTCNSFLEEMDYRLGILWETEELAKSMGLTPSALESFKIPAPNKDLGEYDNQKVEMDAFEADIVASEAAQWIDVCKSNQVDGDHKEEIKAFVKSIKNIREAMKRVGYQPKWI